MTDNSKFLTGIVVGAAAGAAIALLLGTDSGKEVLSEIKSVAEKALRDWTTKRVDAGDEPETAV